MLEGEGSNGKGVVFDILTFALGEENVSNVALELFGERFQLIPTIGKLANVVTEVGELRSIPEALLKAFVAGDRMYSDRKGLQGIEFRPTARMVMAVNNRPRFNDKSQGIWRRLNLSHSTSLFPMSARTELGIRLEGRATRNPELGNRRRAATPATGWLHEAPSLR